MIRHLAGLRQHAAAAGARQCRWSGQAFGWTFPLHTGRAMPVLGDLETAQAILGETGIPTAGQGLPEAPHPAGERRLCRALPLARRRTALTAFWRSGRLTNIAALALARPDLAARITELTWMGGGVTAGNHTASAEFNALADPEALAIVLAHDLPLRMVDLDLCRKVLATPDDVDPVRACRWRQCGTAGRYVRRLRSHRHQPRPARHGDL